MSDELNLSADNAGESGTLKPEALRDLLRNVYDPELQLNLVDLGLIYDVQIRGEGLVHVQMTLTSPGCPYGPQLVAQVKQILMTVRGIKDVDVEVVWTPPWGADKMTEAARLELGLDI